MGELLGSVQTKLKSSSKGILLLIFKSCTGFLLSLTFALVGQEVLGFNSLAFIFMMVVVVGVFLRIARSWGFVGTLVFNLVCVLVGMLLRMYILVAPGA